MTQCVRILFTVLPLVLVVPKATACSICDPAFQRKNTFRETSVNVQMVVIGTLANPQLLGDKGQTELVLESIIKGTPFLNGKKSVILPRYIPINPKQPPRYIVFFDEMNGKIDIDRGVPLTGKATGEYLHGALKVDPQDRVKLLTYYFTFLDSDDSDLATDAFLEFAKASDRDVYAVAPKLNAERLRKLVTHEKTPADRLGLFAYLLGVSGSRKDVTLLTELLNKKSPATGTALSGLLGGLIELKPEVGWEMVIQILKDSRRPYAEKLSAIGTVRFFQICKPKESRSDIVRAYGMVLQNGDLADMAIEDLRRWAWWELTPTVLAQYDKESHSAPLMKRAMVRYALTCPEKAAKEFVKARRVAEPNLVASVEESLEFEKQ